MFVNKGVYSMDVFTQRIVELFKTENIDIENKKLSDAYMPLHIVSSNLTKVVPTIFSDDVYVLEALRCSCCVPFLFYPQQVGDNVYIDGDVLCPNLTALCSPDTIVINLDKRRKRKITPSQLGSMSATEYALDLYTMISMYNQRKQCSTNTISLSYPKLHSDSDISEEYSTQPVHQPVQPVIHQQLNQPVHQVVQQPVAQDNVITNQGKYSFF